MKVDLGTHALNVEIDGPDDGPVVVFGHALGMNLHMWDDVLPHLPAGLRLVRFDMRGHGGSDRLPAPYTMGQLVRDAEQLLDALHLRNVVFVGLSTSGQVAQGLAVKRLDQVRALVLSNTAAKIGQPANWQKRIEEIRVQGVESTVAPTIAAGFSSRDQDTPLARHWAEVLAQAPLETILGGMAAVSGTDFYTPTASLRLPCLGIAGSHDRMTPPDLVRETVDLIPGSTFELMRKSGHFPCLDAPEDFATHLTTLLESIGHVPH